MANCISCNKPLYKKKSTACGNKECQFFRKKMNRLNYYKREIQAAGYAKYNRRKIMKMKEENKFPFNKVSW